MVGDITGNNNGDIGIIELTKHEKPKKKEDMRIYTIDTVIKIPRCFNMENYPRENDDSQRMIELYIADNTIKAIRCEKWDKYARECSILKNCPYLSMKLTGINED